jgi:hypothetical protein
LASFIISTIFVYGPFIGFKFSELGLGSIYAIVAGVNLGVYLLVYFLVPGEIKVFSNLKSLLSSNNEQAQED